MNYSGIIKGDSVNGDGMRLTLFVSGCHHKCRGCFNKETWDSNYGEPFTLQKESELLEYFRSNLEYLDGLSILGGEPLSPKNINTVRGFIDMFKYTFPNKSIWVWTGYTYEELLKELPDNDIILKNTDVLIDGKFIQELYNPSLKYKGSSNQRVINMKESIPDKIVLLYD